MSHANPPKRPKGRALTDFENLSEAEKKLIACTASGMVCDLGKNVPDQPSRHNVIRPELIRFLALGGDENAPVHEKGVRVVGAWIGSATGEDPRGLDFEGARLTTTLLLFNCYLQTPPIFIGSQGKSLLLDCSVFPGLIADRLKLDGSLFLREVRSKGSVRLGGAKIGGNLECHGGYFENNAGYALCLSGATIEGDVFCANGFHAIGEVSLGGASIGGNLGCSGGYFENKDGESLSSDGAKVDGAVFLDIRSGPTDNEYRSFHAIGKVSFIGATIGSSLSCIGGRFENEEGCALSCDGATIGGCVFLEKYHNPIDNFSCPFHASGEVRLIGVAIGGSLSCSGGRFENTNGRSFSCDHINIKGSVFCNNDFHATGMVRFPNAIISGDLDFRSGRFENKGDETVLTCEGARIDGGLIFRKIIQAMGDISLAHATVTTLADEIDCWPDHSLILDGFRYERIDASSSLDSKHRISWLDKQSPELLKGDSFALQPWIHLAKVLREQGHFREAAEVDIAREERLRAAGKVGDRFALLSWAGKWGQLDDEGRYVSFLNSLSEQITWFLHWLYGKFSGYGHRPIKIIYFAVAVWFALALVYFIEADHDHFMLANPSLTKTQFNPWAYSLDLILPVVQLGEFAKWAHVSDGSWVTLSGWTGFLIGAEKIFGWIAALTLAAIAAGLVKRKDG